MSGRKRGQSTFPVRFTLTEAGNYVIWDVDAPPGADLVAGYAMAGTITRGPTGWDLWRVNRGTVQGFPSILAAKNTYLQERTIPIDPYTYINQPYPPSPTCLVTLGMTEWESLEEWRVRIFRALVKSNNPAAITVMFTPIESNYATRRYTLKLPTQVAEDLEEWRNRTS